jgi:hypothetical protein
MAITIRKRAAKSPETAANTDDSQVQDVPVLVEESTANATGPTPQRKKTVMELVLSIVFAVLGFSAVLMVVILIVMQLNENTYYAAPESIWPGR